MANMAAVEIDPARARSGLIEAAAEHLKRLLEKLPSGEPKVSRPESKTVRVRATRLTSPNDGRHVPGG
jgi:hypothetical protein